MADPECLDELFSSIQKFPKIDIIKKKINILYARANEKECSHDHHYIHHGLQICGDCGILMDQITYERDWKCFGNSVSRGNQLKSGNSKSNGRGIGKELMGFGFAQNVSDIADKYYREITITPKEGTTKKRIFRSNNRNALMAVCAFFAHIDVGEPLSSKSVKSKFPNLTQQKFNDQLDQFYEKFPDKTCIYVKPEHLVSVTLRKIGILEESHYKQVRSLCDFLSNTSNLMLSSKPESIAAAIVYLHLCMHPEINENLSLNKASFAKLVGLSEATIDKLVKDAARTLDANISLNLS